MNEEGDIKLESKEERPAWPPAEGGSIQGPPQHINVPIPTTPQGAPVNQVMEFELPFELQQQGWKKFWSKRENRPYFWNKMTGESLWEMPVLKPHFDPITDPLGICTPPPPQPIPIMHMVTAPVPVAKRRASEELQGPQVKKFILAGPWDLDVPTNVIILERAPCSFMHSHPEVEIFRCSFLTKLRKNYEELCHSRESIDAPKDSFNRWLMERKVIDTGKRY